MSGEFFTVRGYKVRQDGGGEFFHGDFLSVDILLDNIKVILGNIMERYDIILT